MYSASEVFLAIFAFSGIVAGISEGAQGFPLKANIL